MPDFSDWNRAEILSLIGLLLVMIGTVAGVAMVRHRRFRQLLAIALTIAVIIGITLLGSARRDREHAVVIDGDRTTAVTKTQTASESNAAQAALIDPPKPVSTRPECREAVINDPDHYTNIRSGPSAKHEVVTRIVEGEVFCVTSLEGRWWRVRTAAGINGYIYYDRVRLTQKSGL